MQRILIIFPLLLCFSACSSENSQGRVAVRGNVTLDGKPIVEGSIQFESLPESQPTVLVGGMIRQGAFSLPTEHGLLPDREYTVRIRSLEEVPGSRIEAADPMNSSVEYRDIIPPRYGSASTLTVSATRKSPNVFQFSMSP